MLKKSNLIILGVLILFLVSCESEHIFLNDQGTHIINTTIPLDTVRFNTEIFTIVQNNCSSCHFEGSSLDLESNAMYSVIISGDFINIENPETSNFFILPDPGHADDYLTTEEHIKIVDWITQGALDN